MIMKKTAVIYWSGTGNTEAMAQAVLAGMQEAGAEAALVHHRRSHARPVRRPDRRRFRLPRYGRGSAGGNGFPAHVG